MFGKYTVFTLLLYKKRFLSPKKITILISGYFYFYFHRYLRKLQSFYGGINVWVQITPTQVRSYRGQSILSDLQVC